MVNNFLEILTSQNRKFARVENVRGRDRIIGNFRNVDSSGSEWSILIYINFILSPTHVEKQGNINS